jgi:hypothetical protein
MARFWSEDKGATALALLWILQWRGFVALVIGVFALSQSTTFKEAADTEASETEKSVGR